MCFIPYSIGKPTLDSSIDEKFCFSQHCFKYECLFFISYLQRDPFCLCSKNRRNGLICYSYSISPKFILSGSVCSGSQYCWLTNWQTQDLNVVFPVPTTTIIAVLVHLHLSSLGFILLFRFLFMCNRTSIQ